MPAPRATQLCPPLNTLDALLLLRSGAVTVGPQDPWRLDLPGAPTDGALELVDPEGVPLARVDHPTVDGDHVVLTEEPVWLAAVSSRPFEQLYLAPGETFSTTLDVPQPLFTGYDTIIADVK